MGVQPVTTRYYIIALDDNADGNAYAVNFAQAGNISDAYNAALKSLMAHDHICITGWFPTYKALNEITLTDLAPYALTLSAGIQFPLSENVNKL